MKHLFFFLVPALFFACETTNYDDLFIEHTDFPYVIDSLFISSVDKANYNILEGSDLKTLYRDVKKTDNEHESKIIRIIEIDSLKKQNVSKEELEKMYWHHDDYRIYALHKLQLKSGIEAYSWYITIGAGAYIFLDQVFVTLFKNKKPYSCFRMGLISVTYQDAHNYIDLRDGIIYEDNKVKLKNYHYEDNDQGYLSEKIELKELSIKTGEIEIVKTEDVEIPTKEKKEENEISRLMNYDALTVGNGTKLYSEASFDSENKKIYNTGELVNILSQSDEREMENTGKACDYYGYFWYKIKDKNNTEGWIYGKNLFKIYKNKNDDVYNKTYRFKDKQYYFSYASDLSYGPADEDGLTGCDVFYLPFFYEEEGKALMLIRYNKDRFEPGEIDWSSGLFDEGVMFLSLESEGGSDRIDEVNPRFYEGGMPCIELILIHGGQDGSTSSKIYVTAEDSQFEISIVHWDKSENQMLN